MRCPKDRSHDQTPSTNQLCGPHRGFVPGTNKRVRVSVIKNTPLKPSCHRTGTATVANPTRNMTMSSEDRVPYQESPNKTIRTSIPQNQRNRDAYPHNGPDLSTHPPRSGKQPERPVRCLFNYHSKVSVVQSNTSFDLKNSEHVLNPS